MIPLLVTGGRLIDPAQGIDMIGDILIRNCRIAAIDNKISPSEPCLVLNASGMVIAPGFIDLHCHLREPGFEHKETIATGTMAAATGGFTTVCCMPNTEPPIDSPNVVEFVQRKARTEGKVRVLSIGCITKGRKGAEIADIRAMVNAGIVAISDDGNTVTNSGLMHQAMEICRNLDIPLIDHCEDINMSAGGMVNEGRVSKVLGLKGVPTAAEEAIVARDIQLAGLTGARVHIAHVSTAGSVELIRRGKDKGIAVTAEVTPHHLTITEEAVIGYNTNAKVNPPLRTQQDMDALIDGLSEGVIDCVATDHAPHTDSDKRCHFNEAAFGISGLETALGALISLVHSERLHLNTLVSKLTSEPANILQRHDLGTLRSGARADIAIFNPNGEWTVDPAAFASKGKNTPLAGRKLRGKVVASIYSGEIVYRDENIKLNMFKVSTSAGFERHHRP